jgi:hypothetical protein
MIISCAGNEIERDLNCSSGYRFSQNAWLGNRGWFLCSREPRTAIRELESAHPHASVIFA